MPFTLQTDVDLAPYTAFRVGGSADCMVDVTSADELLEVLRSDVAEQAITMISYGSNTLISDKGLRGLTICNRGGDTAVLDNTIIADSGVWWDDVVKTAIDHGLWGIEFMSEIPGSVGAAAYINITAYGQAIGPKVRWVDVWNTKTRTLSRIEQQDLSWDYKQSVFQSEEHANSIIIRVCLELDVIARDELTYQKAIDTAKAIRANIGTLDGRRKAIVAARQEASSIWHPDDKDAPRTAGSFFRNPVVDEAVADQVIAYEEHGKTAEQIKLMNKVHGGSTKRVSAAHVMLAAGFNRSQQWGNVKLNDKNLLKIEALDGAKAQDIYDVAQTIIDTCQEKLGVTLSPEAVFLGEF